MSSKKNKPLSVVMVGTGNLAVHLSHALRKAKLELTQIIGRNKSKTKKIASQLGFTSHSASLSKIALQADIYFICINDDEIKKVSSQMKLPGKLVVHCSGTVPLHTLSSISENHAVLYPLYSFSSSDDPVNFKKIPIFIEASNKKSKSQILFISKKLSPAAISLNSLQREKLHLAAVLSANFSNYLFHVAWDYLHKEKVNHAKNLLPLLEKTVSKLHHHSPLTAQTGPARRGDKKTIQKHLLLLKNYPEQKSVYRLLTRLIQLHFQA
jgi:predicted short-subunit dehydrogenase-like oxidoreductase (DUF2520 family)